MEHMDQVAMAQGLTPEPFLFLRPHFISSSVNCCHIPATACLAALQRRQPFYYRSALSALRCASRLAISRRSSLLP
jgi:hypothetical protein